RCHGRGALTLALSQGEREQMRVRPPRPSGERAGVRGPSAQELGIIAYFMLGNVNSAPDLIPAGQRVVTVFSLV
ncbi:MAG: hypothetical protein JWN11_2063, partial [Hyphomicrobiales bacterium]|nr:hypothetical protein [Hyphomicrobiales bacterium]